jgi:IS30 family transposase
MPRGGMNRKSTAVKRRYFELLRQGYKGAAAARMVGVSTSCGSKWFLEAGGMPITDSPQISPRFLTQEDRITIGDGLRARWHKTLIAAAVGKSLQTVYREIQRYGEPDGTYLPWRAHNKALAARKRPRARKIQAGTPLCAVVRGKLDERWSPQQISRFLTRSFPEQASMRACAETIYRGLFDGLLGRKAGKLRTGRSRRKAHRRGVAVPNKIKDMTLLGQRPAEVNERRAVGHWEGDLIIGAKMGSAIGTLVERVTRYLVLIHLPDGYKAPQLRDALIARTSSIPARLRRSITWDQGREMALHKQITAATGFDVYFCDPHSPWQRGTNENTNGLLRQYFPKRSDLSIHTQADLEKAAAQLNDRPRLILGDHTPAEAVANSLLTR